MQAGAFFNNTCLVLLLYVVLRYIDVPSHRDTQLSVAVVHVSTCVEISTGMPVLCAGSPGVVC